MTFIDSYREALDVQQRCQQEEFQQQQQLSVFERVQRGYCMVNLSIEVSFFAEIPDDYCSPLPEGVGYIQYVKVRCYSNLSKFREGTQVRLSRGDYSFLMEVVEDSVLNFVLAPNAFERHNCFMSMTDYPRFNWTVELVETDTTYRMLLSTIDCLDQNKARLEQISSTLDGQYQSAYSADVRFASTALNDSQNSAVARALATDYLHLIQGPPGTGKTHTIAYICQQLLEQHCRVFVSGPTHTAINNCLNKIAALVQDGSKLVKIGEKHQAQDLVDDGTVARHTRLSFQRYLADPSLSHEGIVVGATPYSLCFPATKRLDGWDFDYALIDEAAQMSIPMAVTVMAHCSKIIFIGDHQQLSPIMPSDTGIAMFQKSIFKHLADLYPADLTLLDVSYRLSPSLLDVPNQVFYQGRLRSEAATSQPYRSMHTYTRCGSLLQSDASALLFLHSEFDGLGHSPYEASVVSDLVFELLNNGVSLHDIAILTPYRAQVREVRQSVYERGVLNERDVQQLFVDTVDRMQGQERDYVIYTLANSNPLENEDRLDFFYDSHRLNVALTRAKVKCVVVANQKVFDIAETLVAEMEPSFLRGELESFVRYRQLSHRMQFDPLDDSDVWL